MTAFEDCLEMGFPLFKMERCRLTLDRGALVEKASSSGMIAIEARSIVEHTPW
jgi:hypothetical protein